MSRAVTVLDAAAARLWYDIAAAGFSDAEVEINALNVFPVPDGDTGTNLMVTMAAAAQAARDFSADDFEALTREVSRAALLAARGNAGIILSEFLRGAGEALAVVPRPAGVALAGALERAADCAYAAVDRPVEGTMLTVLRAAADEAMRAGSDDLVCVASAACQSAELALVRTPEQLPALAAAGVVDAGGRGICVLLDALHRVVSGEATAPSPAGSPTMTPSPSAPASVTTGPAFEVMYLLEMVDQADALPAIAALRTRLAVIGDSLLVVGGGGLWNVHVHVDDVGAAIEAGLEAGRPRRIRVTHFASQIDGHRSAGPPMRRVVAVTAEGGLVTLLEHAGANVVDTEPGQNSTRELERAIEQTGSAEIVVLPVGADMQPLVEGARRARSSGIRVAVVPTTEPVQALAALAVHDAGRAFDDDVIAMTAAARATRTGALVVAERRAITSVGVVEEGQVIGLVEGEVVGLGESLLTVGTSLLDSMLYAGGELVTFIIGKDCPAEIADALVGHVRGHRPDVEVAVYGGQQARNPVLIGVE